MFVHKQLFYVTFDFFFIHVHTVCQMLQDNMKEIETYYSNDLMCVYVSECYDFITPFFRVREINPHAETVL